MKKPFRKILNVALLGFCLASASVAHGQSAQTTESSSTTTRTTTAGTVSGFTPDALVLQTSDAPGPVTYSYSRTTTYVDENGNPLSVETVHTGEPVTVYYTRDGGRFVANKVVVRRTTTTVAPAVVSPPAPVVEEKKTTTTTTTTTSP